VTQTNTHTAVNLYNDTNQYTSSCKFVQWHKPIHRPSHTVQVFVVNPHSEDLSNNIKDYRQVLMMFVVKTRTCCTEWRSELWATACVLFCFTVWTYVQLQWTLQHDIAGDLTISTHVHNRLKLSAGMLTYLSLVRQYVPVIHDILNTRRLTIHNKQPPLLSQGLLTVEDSWSNSVGHTTFGRTSLDEWPVRRKDVYLTEYKANIYATGGIRTRSHNKREAAEPHLRSRGHWNRPDSTYTRKWHQRTKVRAKPGQ
jgi:hypothetical protein